jgi:hypothetical protein
MNSIDLDAAIGRESSSLASWMAADWLAPDAPQQQDIDPSESEFRFHFEMEDIYPSDGENLVHGVRRSTQKV